MSSFTTIEARLRIAHVEDLTRLKPDGTRVWIDGKDFWAIGIKGDIQYYRMNITHPEIPKMAKEFLPLQRILVVDVEGEEREWSGGE